MVLTMTRYILLQARNADDIVQPEEHQAFATQLGTTLEQITPINIFSTPLNESLLEGYDAVLVGGAGEHSVLDNTPEIKSFINFLGLLSTKQFPTFASCFGFQALVLALGGTVIKDVPNAEVGTYTLYSTGSLENDPVFSVLPAEFLAQLGHQDRAEILPDSVENFAYSDRAPYQAFRVRGAPIFATQFHPELTYLDNRLRFERYMVIYGALFGQDEAQRRLDSHRPSPHANKLLSRFASFLQSS